MLNCCKYAWNTNMQNISEPGTYFHKYAPNKYVFKYDKKYFWKMGSPWKSQPATHPPFLCLPNCGGPPGNIRVVKLIVGDMGPLSVKSFIGLCLWIFGALLGVFEHWTLDDDDASWTCTGLHPLSPLPQLEVQSPEIKMTKSIRM